MRVSHYEIHATCKRAFGGLGFPEGVDEDAAHMVTWSELQGLHGLEHLRISLPELDGTSSGRLAPPARRDGVVLLDGGGQSILATASTALDLATTLASEEGSVEVILRNCRDQVLAVAMAVSAGRAGYHIRLRWRSGDQIFLCEARNGAHISSIPSGDAEPVEAGVLHISVAKAAGEKKTIPEGEPRWSLSAERPRTMLARGIDVPDELWAALQRYGQRMLVPATAESRARGAGGGNANE